jgi:hypothetical protein
LEPITVVVTADTLLVGFGSGLEALTVAVFLILLPAGAVTLTTRLIPAPVGWLNENGFSLPIVQVTVLLLNVQGVNGPGVADGHVKWPPLMVHEAVVHPALTKLVSVGRVSLTTTPLAGAGPKLMAAIP